jgi:hypothetical protein
MVPMFLPALLGLSGLGKLIQRRRDSITQRNKIMATREAKAAEVRARQEASGRVFGQAMNTSNTPTNSVSSAATTDPNTAQTPAGAANGGFMPETVGMSGGNTGASNPGTAAPSNSGFMPETVGMSGEAAGGGPITPITPTTATTPTTPTPPDQSGLGAELGAKATARRRRRNMAQDALTG